MTAILYKLGGLFFGSKEPLAPPVPEKKDRLSISTPSRFTTSFDHPTKDKNLFFKDCDRDIHELSYGGKTIYQRYQEEFDRIRNEESDAPGHEERKEELRQKINRDFEQFLQAKIGNKKLVKKILYLFSQAIFNTPQDEVMRQAISTYGGIFQRKYHEPCRQFVELIIPENLKKEPVTILSQKAGAASLLLDPETGKAKELKRPVQYNFTTIHRLSRKKAKATLHTSFDQVPAFKAFDFSSPIRSLRSAGPDQSAADLLDRLKPEEFERVCDLLGHRRVYNEYQASLELADTEKEKVEAKADAIQQLLTFLKNALQGRDAETLIPQILLHLSPQRFLNLQNQFEHQAKEKQKLFVNESTGLDERCVLDIPSDVSKAVTIRLIKKAMYTNASFEFKGLVHTYNCPIQVEMDAAYTLGDKLQAKATFSLNHPLGSLSNTGPQTAHVALPRGTMKEEVFDVMQKTFETFFEQRYHVALKAPALIETDSSGDTHTIKAMYEEFEVNGASYEHPIQVEMRVQTRDDLVRDHATFAITEI